MWTNFSPSSNFLEQQLYTIIGKTATWKNRLETWLHHSPTFSGLLLPHFPSSASSGLSSCQCNAHSETVMFPFQLHKPSLHHGQETSLFLYCNLKLNVIVSTVILLNAHKFYSLQSLKYLQSFYTV